MDPGEGGDPAGQLPGSIQPAFPLPSRRAFEQLHSPHPVLLSSYIPTGPRALYPSASVTHVQAPPLSPSVPAPRPFRYSPAFPFFLPSSVCFFALSLSAGAQTASSSQGDGVGRRPHSRVRLRFLLSAASTGAAHLTWSVGPAHLPPPSTNLSAEGTWRPRRQPISDLRRMPRFPFRGGGGTGCSRMRIRRDAGHYGHKPVAQSAS